MLVVAAKIAHTQRCLPSSESNCLSACLPATYSFCLDIFMQLAAEIVHIVFYASLICKQRATEPFTASANFWCPLLFGGQGTRLNHSMRASSASNSAFIECTNPISSKLFGGNILKPKSLGQHLKMKLNDIPGASSCRSTCPQEAIRANVANFSPCCGCSAVVAPLLHPQPQPQPHPQSGDTLKPHC